MRARLLTLAIAAAAATGVPPDHQTRADIQFVFSADAHYGISRAAFRGATTVPARAVNQALVAAINSLGSAVFPCDGGIGACAPVGPVDFMTEGGDVANRAEIVDGTAIQPAATSWRQFLEDYGALTLTDRTGQRAPLFVVPGNHEASNSLGFHRPMHPARDPSALIAIYNLMVRPPAPLTAAAYDYLRDRVHTSRDIGGVHFVFLHVWPDSSERAWLADDLARVPASMPVFIFTHDEPDSEAKHFRNPNAPHDINAIDKFENILSDTLADGATTAVTPVAEQAALERFIAAHSNVVAYFHGNSNWNQFYDWTGPHETVTLHAFRVDSPMKGKISGKDETKLSFQVASIDVASRTMTVREVLWNARPLIPSLTWGDSVTVGLSPRPRPNHTLSTAGGQ